MPGQGLARNRKIAGYQQDRGYLPVLTILLR